MADPDVNMNAGGDASASAQLMNDQQTNGGEHAKVSDDLNAPSSHPVSGGGGGDEDPVSFDPNVEGTVYQVVDPKTNELQTIVLPPGYQLVQDASTGEYQCVETSELEGVVGAEGETAGMLEGQEQEDLETKPSAPMPQVPEIPKSSTQAVITGGDETASGHIPPAESGETTSDKIVLEKLDDGTARLIVPPSLVNQTDVLTASIQQLLPELGGVTQVQITTHEALMQQAQQAQQAAALGNRRMAPMGNQRQQMKRQTPDSGQVVKMRSGFLCKECAFETRFMKDINRHVKVEHTTIRPFRCPEEGCDYADVDDTTFSDHYAAKHRDQVAQYLPNHYLQRELTKVARTLFSCEIREVSTFEQALPEPGVKHLHSPNGMRIVADPDYFPDKAVDDQLTGKPPYYCLECDFSCLSILNIVGHLKSEHLQHATFRCPYCETESYDETFVLNHVAKEHGTFAAGVNINIPLERKLEKEIRGKYVRGSSAYIQLKGREAVNVRNDVPQGDSEQAHVRLDFSAGQPGLPMASFANRIMYDGFNIGSKGVRGKRTAQSQNRIAQVLSDGVKPKVTTIRDKHGEVQRQILTLYSCRHCPFKSTSQRVIISHCRNTHVTDKPYSCPTCGYSAIQKRVVMNHMMRRHPHVNLEPQFDETIQRDSNRVVREMYSCFCKVIEKEDGLVEDPADDDGSAQQPIEIKFNGENQYDESSHPVLNYFKYLCRMCDYGAKYEFHMKRHVVKFHTNYTPYSCSLCGYAATNDMAIANHIVQLHMEEQRASMETNQPLVDALETATAAVYFLNPEFCDRTTHSIGRTQVETSMRGTGGSFQLSAPKEHVAVASSEEPQPIPPPNDTAAIERLYAIWQSDPKPWHVCTVCYFSSRSKISITRHIRAQHANINPFACGYCAFKCYDKAAIVPHTEQSHAGRVQAKCIVDEELFQALEEYVQMHHEVVGGGMHNELDPSEAFPDQLKTEPALGTEKYSETTETVYPGSTFSLDEPEKKYNIRRQQNAHLDREQEAEDLKMLEDAEEEEPEQEEQMLVQMYEFAPHLYGCNLCGFAQIDREPVFEHVCEVHCTMLRPMRCKYCNLSMFTERQVLDHVQTEHPEQRPAVLANARVMKQLHEQIAAILHSATGTEGSDEPVDEKPVPSALDDAAAEHEQLVQDDVIEQVTTMGPSADEAVVQKPLSSEPEIDAAVVSDPDAAVESIPQVSEERTSPSKKPEQQEDVPKSPKSPRGRGRRGAAAVSAPSPEKKAAAVEESNEDNVDTPTKSHTEAASPAPERRGTRARVPTARAAAASEPAKKQPDDKSAVEEQKQASERPKRKRAALTKVDALPTPDEETPDPPVRKSSRTAHK